MPLRIPALDNPWNLAQIVVDYADGYGEGLFPKDVKEALKQLGAINALVHQVFLDALLRKDLYRSYKSGEICPLNEVVSVQKGAGAPLGAVDDKTFIDAEGVADGVYLALRFKLSTLRLSIERTPPFAGSGLSFRELIEKIPDVPMGTIRNLLLFHGMYPQLPFYFVPKVSDLQVLGKGSSGTVYDWQAQDGQRFALKTDDEGLSLIEHFKYVRAFLHVPPHESIVPFLGMAYIGKGDEKKRWAYVFEKVDGSCLRTYPIAGCTRAEIVQIVTDIAAGLQHFNQHKYGYSLDECATRNIMVTKAKRAKLIDYDFHSSYIPRASRVRTRQRFGEFIQRFHVDLIPLGKRCESTATLKEVRWDQVVGELAQL